MSCECIIQLITTFQNNRIRPKPLYSVSAMTKKLDFFFPLSVFGKAGNLRIFKADADSKSQKQTAETNRKRRNIYSVAPKAWSGYLSQIDSQLLIRTNISEWVSKRVEIADNKIQSEFLNRVSYVIKNLLVCLFVLQSLFGISCLFNKSPTHQYRDR